MLIISISRPKEKKELLYQDRLRTHKKKNIDVPQQNNVALPKIQSDILVLEQKYTEFFAERMLEWEESKKRSAWVIL